MTKHETPFGTVIQGTGLELLQEARKYADRDQNTPVSTTPSHPTPGLSVTAYTGDRGQAYWERNRARCQADAPLRRIRIREMGRAAVGEGKLLLPWCEVGCGEGYNMYPGDVGVDCDPRALRHLLPHKIPVIGTADHLPFPDKSFPLVYCVGLLMHLQEGEWQRALEEMGRVAISGVLIGEYISEQTREKENPFWGGLLWERLYIPPHGWTFRSGVEGVSPFDPDVTFLLFTPQ